MRPNLWSTLVLLSFAVVGTGCRMCASHDDYTYPVKQCGSTCDECGDCSDCGSCSSCTSACSTSCGGGYYEMCGHVRSGSANGGTISGEVTEEYIDGEETYEVSAKPGKKTR